MTPLCTIGYEGFSSEEWLDSLVTNRIETVVDVREMLLSRKPGFPKLNWLSRYAPGLSTTYISSHWETQRRIGIDFAKAGISASLRTSTAAFWITNRKH